MKINRSFARCGRKFISVALCLVMMFTTFFIFEPSVLSELLPKASAADVVYSKVTNENGTWTSGTDYTLSGSTYTIKTGNGFAYFLKNPTTFNGKKVVLDCNVDFSGITYAYWDDSATAWYGELDGANHIVANYKQSIDNKERRNVGGFGVIRKMSGGIVKDLTIKNTYIKVLNRKDDTRTNVYGLGALIGKIEGESSAAYTDVQINNVTVDGATIIKFGRDGRENDYGYGCGGIVGQTFKKTVFTNCKVINTKVSPNQDDNRRGNKEGGFVGESIGAEIIIKNDTPMVSVASTTVVYDKDLPKKDSDHGGLIGWTSGKTTIENVIMEGTVYSGESGGGFIGYIQNAEANITNSTMSGEVSAQNNCGGFIGNSSGATFNISNCNNSGKVTGNDNVGGIIGSGSGKLTMDQCNNTGSVTGQQYVGGLVGLNNTDSSITITNSDNKGIIWGGHKHIGGIIGYATAGSAGITIKNCSNTAKSFYAQNEFVGGIIGKNDSNNLLTLENCHNTSTLNVKANWIGGLVGYDKGKLVMKNCTNTANITGYQHTAGLIAGIEDDGCEITNCLNTGNVSTSNNSNASGILATIQGQTNSSVWTIKDVVNTGMISGAAAVGSILGYAEGSSSQPFTLENCINKADVTGTGADVGGIVGNMNSDGNPHRYTNCVNYGNVYTSSNESNGVFVAGITAKEKGFGVYTNCINYGSVTASTTSANSIAGGIVGWIEDDTNSVTGCINYGAIKGRNNVGGIVGEMSAAYNGVTLTIKQCGNYGNIFATAYTTNTMLGGIIGRYDGKKKRMIRSFIFQSASTVPRLR